MIGRWLIFKWGGGWLLEVFEVKRGDMFRDSKWHANFIMNIYKNISVLKAFVCHFFRMN